MSTTKKDPGPFGPVVEWTLKHRDGEERTYRQTELAIEGEARMLGLAHKAGSILKDRAFNFEDLVAMVDDGQPRWKAILDAIGIIVEEAPGLIAEAALVLLGIYPTNLDGTPNREFDDHERFIRATVSSAKFFDMMRVFVTQNDYQRMAGPFWNRFQSGREPEMQAPPVDTSVSTG